MKKCRCCNIEKSVDEFYKRADGKPMSYCKECTKAKSRARQAQLAGKPALPTQEKKNPEQVDRAGLIAVMLKRERTEAERRAFLRGLQFADSLHSKYEPNPAVNAVMNALRQAGYNPDEVCGTSREYGVVIARKVAVHLMLECGLSTTVVSKTIGRDLSTVTYLANCVETWLNETAGNHYYRKERQVLNSIKRIYEAQ